MRIGPYETVSELGRGGMGVVYRARSKDGRDVALKLLVAAHPDALSRFERETRLQELLSEKEGLVPLLDRGSSPQGPYVVMPLLEGGTLQDRIKRGPLEVEETRALGERLASTLGKAHARGIVHRDLKPANVLFDGEGRAFIADLGLAKHFRHDLPGASQSRSLTHGGSSAGTIGYMAPEQLNDAKTVGPAADVFALGAILHECLSGERAFPGRGLLEYVKSVERGEVPDLHAVREEVPERLAKVVKQALEYAPADRFEGGEALARALRECAGE